MAASQDSFYVKVVGLATMTNSAGLQEVLEGACRGGIRRFIFDLEECSGFDSTFMGILLGVALQGDGKNGESNGSSPDGKVLTSVMLVNATAAHSKLLAGVGIDRLVHLRREPLKLPPVDLKRLEDGTADPQRRIRSIVYAHENLVRLGGPNIEKFGAMLEALKRELED